VLGFIADDTQHYVEHEPFHEMFDHNNPAPQRRASGSIIDHTMSI
jgi:hypothetical protein